MTWLNQETFDIWSISILIMIPYLGFRQVLALRVLVIVGMSDSIYIELTTEIVGNKGALLFQILD